MQKNDSMQERPFFLQIIAIITAHLRNNVHKHKASESLDVRRNII